MFKSLFKSSNIERSRSKAPYLVEGLLKCILAYLKIYLRPFDRDDAVSMLKKLFDEGNMEFNDCDAEAIA